MNWPRGWSNCVRNFLAIRMIEKRLNTKCGPIPIMQNGRNYQTTSSKSKNMGISPTINIIRMHPTANIRLQASLFYNESSNSSTSVSYSLLFSAVYLRQLSFWSSSICIKDLLRVQPPLFCVSSSTLASENLYYSSSPPSFSSSSIRLRLGSLLNISCSITFYYYSNLYPSK